MGEILDYWRDKNIARFGQSKQSGDDCHETVEAQLDYFRKAGFSSADCPWQKQMWALLRGRK
jgi:tRNA (cmo5U34)-methyltransferase